MRISNRRASGVGPLVVLTMLLASTVVGCGDGGGAGGSAAEFCDEAADHRDAFTGHARQVSPAIIGAMRDLAHDAPDEVRDAFEQALSASSDDERADAFASIKDYLRDECDLTLR